jgi:hypothetical protein
MSLQEKLGIDSFELKGLGAIKTKDLIEEYGIIEGLISKIQTGGMMEAITSSDSEFLKTLDTTGTFEGASGKLKTLKDKLATMEDGQDKTALQLEVEDIENGLKKSALEIALQKPEILQMAFKFNETDEEKKTKLRSQLSDLYIKILTSILDNLKISDEIVDKLTSSEFDTLLTEVAKAEKNNIPLFFIESLRKDKNNLSPILTF